MCPQITLECPHCHESFAVPRWQAKKRKYCSHSCASVNKVGVPYKTGPEHGNHKGGNTSVAGYRRVYENGVLVYEHRLTMERHLGRKLRPDEHIHHINEDKSDNRIENLKIVSNSEHIRLHSPHELRWGSN